MARTRILGSGFDHVTMEEAQVQLGSFVVKGNSHLVVTANPEVVMKAKADQLLAEILERSNLVVADGIGVIWASRLIGEPLPERIPGIELAEGLLRQATDSGWKVFLLGGKEGVVDAAKEALLQKLPTLQIVGTHHGYFKPGLEEEKVVNQIKDTKPDVLLVALGVPRQEKWLAAHLGVLKVPVAIGVGGSFNVWAGVDKRAPLWIRKINLEWLYRLLRQPWRLKRVAVLPVFVLAVLISRFQKGR